MLKYKFEVPINNKFVYRGKQGAFDERGLIKNFVDAHNFDGSYSTSEAISLSHLQLGRYWIDDNLKSDQTLDAQPNCITKSWTSWYPFNQYSQAPRFLMGVFFSSVRGDQVDAPLKDAMTFSELKKAIHQQDKVLEGGFTPIRATQKWMREPTSAYFITAKAASELLDQEQRDFLFGAPVSPEA